MKMDERTLKEIIGEAVGEASMLWINKDGTFDSEKGIKITEETIHSILELCRKQVPGEYKMVGIPSLDREMKGHNACRQEMLENLERLGR